MCKSRRISSIRSPTHSYICSSFSATSQPFEWRYSHQLDNSQPNEQEVSHRELDNLSCRTMCSNFRSLASSRHQYEAGHNDYSAEKPQNHDHVHCVMNRKAVFDGCAISSAECAETRYRLLWPRLEIHLGSCTHVQRRHDRQAQEVTAVLFLRCTSRATQIILGFLVYPPLLAGLVRKYP
jgi:hypothetical protein